MPTLQKGSTSVILRVPIVVGGTPQPGLTFASSGLVIRLMASDGTYTTFTGGNILDITTLGTWADPGSGKIRFKPVSDADFAGIYELHLRNSDIPSSAGSRTLDIYIVDAAVVSGGYLYSFDLSSFNAAGTAGSNLQSAYASVSIPQVNLKQIDGVAVPAVGGILDTGIDPALLGALGKLQVDVFGWAGIPTTVSTVGGDDFPDVNASAVGGSTAVTMVNVYSIELENTETATDGLFTLTWHKNDNPISPSDSPAPTIRLIKWADGTDLLAATAMTQIGSTGIWKYTRTGALLVPGVPVIAEIIATVDSVVRTRRKLLGIDVA